MSLFKTVANKVLSKKKSLSRRIAAKEVRYSSFSHEEGYQKNIIFVLPALRSACGGNIVCHSHSDAINSAAYKGFQSQILYPKEPNFNPTNFVHESKLKTDLNLDPKKDFVILPDVAVVRNADQLNRLGVPYAINVANGYLMDLEIKFYNADFQTLKSAYQKAKFIISMSDDTTENIKLIFPDCADKIIGSSYVIDKAVFKPISEKQNTITYMPRKLAKHSEMLLFFLNDKLPAHWKLVPIDGVSEAEVYRILSDSKIFLSFSEFEGKAMPPVMAALSGNLVIGYTGEGNKEYYHPPCFQEVMCGDMKDFVIKILRAVEIFDAGLYKTETAAITQLAEAFSPENHLKFLKHMIDLAEENFNKN